MSETEMPVLLESSASASLGRPGPSCLAVQFPAEEETRGSVLSLSFSSFPWLVVLCRRSADRCGQGDVLGSPTLTARLRTHNGRALLVRPRGALRRPAELITAQAPANRSLPGWLCPPSGGRAPGSSCGLYRHSRHCPDLGARRSSPCQVGA